MKIMNYLTEMLSYPIDETIMREKERAAVSDARECHHTAIELKRLGYPAMAAWEASLCRRHMVEARLAKACCT